MKPHLFQEVNSRLAAWRRAFLEMLQDEQPVDLPSKGAEAHLQPGYRYVDYENPKTRIHGSDEDREGFHLESD